VIKQPWNDGDIAWYTGDVTSIGLVEVTLKNTDSSYYFRGSYTHPRTGLRMKDHYIRPSHLTRNLATAKRRAKKRLELEIRCQQHDIKRHTDLLRQAEENLTELDRILG
jgi:hypothetical protein